MPLISFFFLLGVLLFQQMPQIPSAAWLLLGLPLSLLLFRLDRAWRLPVVGALAFLWAQAYALLTCPAELPPSWLHTEVWVQGRVVGIPKLSDQYLSFDVEVHELEQSSERLQGHWRIRLGWEISDFQDPLPRAGDQWRWLVKLKPVHGFASPGAFDYEGWMYFQGIRYRGQVRHSQAEWVSTHWSLDAVRQNLSERLARNGGREEAIMQALLTGDRNSLSSADMDLFAATGTSHLIAISGLHITLVAGMVFWLVQAGWRRIPRLCRRWPAKVAAAWPALMVATGYAALAGFAVPTQRALVMLLVVMAAQVSRRPVAAGDSLALALLAVLLLDPPAVLEAGFWLSYLAVAIILYLGQDRAGRWAVVRMQLWISIGLVPVLSLYQMNVALLGPLVNLVAIPLFDLLVVPWLFLATLMLALWQDLGNGLLDGLARLLHLFLFASDLLVQSFPGLVLSLQANWLTALAFALGCALLSLPRGMPGKWAGAMLCLPLLWPKLPDAPQLGEFRLALLDVGQGLAAIVRTANHVLVFDAGPRFASGFEAGSAVVVPYLRSLGVSKLDSLVLSHSDIDHTGGAKALLARIPAEQLLGGEPISGITHPQFSLCAAGKNWRWDGVDFQVLQPLVAGQAQDNAASCVLRVSSAFGSLLLTGDVEQEGEQAMLNHAPEMLGVNLVVAAHHGSNSSSSAEFIAASRASIVLFSSGYGNRWGFPSGKVVRRWQDAGATAYDTAQGGTLEVTYGVGVESGVLHQYRAERVRYWMTTRSMH